MSAEKPSKRFRVHHVKTEYATGESVKDVWRRYRDAGYDVRYIEEVPWEEETNEQPRKPGP